jgi:two-component system sensor histidine kinase BaeS
MRRRFLRRIGFLLIVLFGLLLLAFVLGALIFGHHGGGPPDNEGWRNWNGPPIGGIVVLLIGAFVIYRFLRRTAEPVSELMEATGRLADGDYSTRVEPRGSSESRDLARAFNALAERLQQNESQRRALIADVTHELRTPLSVIRGAAEGIVDGVYPGDPAHVTPIVEEVEMMARLLEDLAMLSTAEAGLLTLTKEPVDLRQLAEEQVAAFMPRFQAKGVGLENAVPASLGSISADPLRLRQVVSNLLANSLQHTSSGESVRIEAELTGETVVLRVIDTGEGILPDQLPHVFERFRKAEDSPGSGLGLAIARSLIEAHGGTIRASSALGEGTKITIELPVAG